MGGGRLEAGRAGPAGVRRERGARGGPGRAGGDLGDHRARPLDDRARPQGPTARRMKARSIPTATRSSNASTRKSSPRRPPASPSSGRHEEEGAGRQLQEWRNRLSSAARSAAREAARLRGQDPWQGGTLRGLRRGRQRGLGQRRGHRRRGGACSPIDPHVARAHGAWALSECPRVAITADCCGSNRVRVRLWKRELQTLADESGLTLRVHHYPPGTSKWNRIEHQLFCHVTQNWRDRPLIGPPRRGRTDRRDDDQDRAQSRVRARYADLREGRQGLGCRDGEPRHHRRRVPS
ncbi:hypothetical protein MES5069_50003 [Mesorhizobium escarrei]|uniref:Transposase n=1 Tax=Mesorhizobium escarrei TaxID=666018 RepID=A0ABM9SFU8_9HYPH|nr:hypothetical protein MES5069_50003 [Mesorhizobium escarrei]